MSIDNNENNNEDYIHDSTVEVDLPATFGDLCEVEGYGARVFKVFGYRIESCYTAEREWTDVVYELIDAVNSEWVEADADDLELLADAEDAELYMKTVDYENYPASFMQTLGLGMPDGDGWGAINEKNNEGGVNMAKNERKPTAREMSAKLAEERKQARKDKANKTDDLLDLLTWVNERFRITGERRYKEWSETIKADLANMHPKDASGK